VASLIHVQSVFFGKQLQQFFVRIDQSGFHQIFWPSSKMGLVAFRTSLANTVVLFHLNRNLIRQVDLLKFLGFQR